jgi:hypothetical protein
MGVSIIDISSSADDFTDGIYKFENCQLRNKEKLTKQGCCSTVKIEGYYCNALNKFPVSFSKDCQNCSHFREQSATNLR